MIYPQTEIKVIDNSNASLVRCVGVLRKKYSNYGTVGDLFVGVVIRVRQSTKKKTVKKGSVVTCLLVCSKKNTSYNSEWTGVFFKTNYNGCVLIDKKSIKKSPYFLGSRVKGPVPNLIRQKGYYKCYSISSTVLLCCITIGLKNIIIKL